LFISFPGAGKISANPRGTAIEDLTFIKKYVIILKKDIFTGPIGEQVIETLFDNYIKILYNNNGKVYI
jgi:hypothetical protein